jgi:dipeptidyl aminopeptidase/acylaminoacyl peptidase
MPPPMVSTTLAAASLLLIAAPGVEIAVQAFSREPARHPVTLDDLVGLRYIRDLALAPDGRRLAYVVSGDRSADSVWVVTTTPGSRPRSLGPGKLPRWAPNGTTLAFYSARGGSFQLWLYEEATGAVRPLTHVRGGIRPSAPLSGPPDELLLYSWAPDGKQLVFTMEVSVGEAMAPPSDSLTPAPPPIAVVLDRTAPLADAMAGVFAVTPGNRFVHGRFTQTSKDSPRRTARMSNQVFVVAVHSGEVRQLTTDTAGYFYPAWSPNGRTLAVASPEGRPATWHLPDTTQLYLVGVATGQATRLTTGPGQKRLPVWTPRGTKVAYLARPQFFGLSAIETVPADGSAPASVVSGQLDRNVADFQFAPDGRAVYAAVPNGVTQPVVRIELGSGRVEWLTLLGEVISEVAVAPSGTLAWVRSDRRHSQVLMVAPHPGGTPQVLVDINPQTASWQLGEQRVVRWRNQVGDTLEGVVILPVGYQAGRRYPLVVDGYSGRRDVLQATTVLANQTLAQRGYVVFFPNHRAPHTYQNYQLKGRAYEDKGRGPGGIAVLIDDLTSGVDTLIAHGLVDARRMCLFGFSNGGASVSYVLTRTSRFRCAVAAAPAVTDRALSFFLNWDPSYALFWADGHAPWERPELYAALSPVYQLDRIQTPLLLAVGDHDVGFILGTLALYRGLRWLERDVTLVRYPGQGHVLTGAALADFWARVYAFFAEHLTPT